MGKAANVVKAVKAVAAVVSSNQPSNLQTFTVVAPKRPLVSTCTQKGATASYSNAATYQALLDAAAKHGGKLSAAQAKAVCVEQKHKGFYAYAVNKLRVLQPVTA